MKVSNLLKLSTRMFRTRPMRTGLTILGISVGISAVLFLVALGYGLQNIILQKIVFNEALLSITVTPKEELIALTDDRLNDFKAIPHVQAVAPAAALLGQVGYESTYSSVAVKGVSPNFFSYSGRAAKIGRILNDNSGDEVVVSDAVLKLFDIANPADIINKNISLKLFIPTTTESGSGLEAVDISEQFKVVGVIDEGQEVFVYLPIAKLHQFTPINQYEQAQVKVDDNKYLNDVKGIIIDKGFQTQSLSETIDQANKIFRIIQIMLGLFGAVALVVSYIGMFNTMTVTLLERTNEIGIMRAIGASKMAVRNLFLAESIIIGFLGGLVGIVLGFVGGTVFNFGINLLAARFGGAQVDLFLYPRWFMFAILGLSLFIGFFSGIFPARRAAAMDPLEALRYK